MVESQKWFFGQGFVIFAIKGPPYAAMTTSSTTHSSCRGGHNVARSTPFGLSGPACTGFSWKNLALYLHYLPWRRHLAAGATGSTRRSGGSGIERGGDIHPVSIYEGSLSWNKGIRYSSYFIPTYNNTNVAYHQQWYYGRLHCHLTEIMQEFKLQMRTHYYVSNI